MYLTSSLTCSGISSDTPAFADIVYEMGAISGLGVASSAHSVDHKSDWPFVTLSNFHHR